MTNHRHFECGFAGCSVKETAAVVMHSKENRIVLIAGAELSALAFNYRISDKAALKI